jgi:hypothetical protein
MYADFLERVFNTKVERTHQWLKIDPIRDYLSNPWQKLIRVYSRHLRLKKVPGFVPFVSSR